MARRSARAFVAWTLLSIGALLDGRRWALPVEAARVAAGAGTIAVLLARHTA